MKNANRKCTVLILRRLIIAAWYSLLSEFKYGALYLSTAHLLGDHFVFSRLSLSITCLYRPYSAYFVHSRLVSSRLNANLFAVVCNNKILGGCCTPTRRMLDIQIVVSNVEQQRCGCWYWCSLLKKENTTAYST